MPTQLPAFPNPVHDTQRTFRTVLDAMAHPGRIGATAAVVAPVPLQPSAAAVCLTLLDFETHLWLQPGFSAEAQQWLQFHTGCRWARSPQTAAFALIWDAATCPSLDTFQQGTAEYPETSTTLILQLPALSGGEMVTLAGPGILGSRAIAPPLPPTFWLQWQANHQHYPLGVDLICCAGTDLLALPRTSHAIPAPS